MGQLRSKRGKQTGGENGGGSPLAGNGIEEGKRMGQKLGSGH